MESKALEENLIVRYLLGNLPEEEQARLEDQAFADREYLRSIEDAENDLIDEYVRGALTADERRRFESRFLVSTERQRKVEFARALGQITAGTATENATQPAATVHWWEALRALLNGLHPASQLALATAALLLVIGVPWLIRQTMHLRAQVTQLQAQQQSPAQTEELRRQLAEQQQRNAELTRQLQGEQQQLAQLQEELAQAARPVVASLLLLPGLSRGSTQHSQLTIPRDAQQVRLQIGIERGDDYPRYRVELRTATGREVVQRGNLAARNGRAGREVVLLLPTSALSAGDYELALKGVKEREVADLGFYYFSVLKK